jgi:epoxyqueuosine reductase
MSATRTAPDLDSLRAALTTHARELGFDGVGVSGVELPADEAFLQSWLQEGRHGEMNYMQHHGLKRSRPKLLVPGTVRVISVRMNYWPAAARAADVTLANGEAAYISRYALGRDYHKVLRGALKALAAQMATLVAPFNARVCVDSAPVLEKALARNAGLGWIGKHTNLYRPATARRCSRHCPLRQLQCLHSCLPHGRDHGALAAGCAPLHFVPHH